MFFNHKQRHLNMTMYLCIVLLCFVVLFYFSLIFFLFLLIMSSLKTHVSIGESWEWVQVHGCPISFLKQINVPGIATSVLFMLYLRPIT